MNQSKTLNFLINPGSERLRREIKNICDSYSHPWDILAELCQNSIDAINLYRKKFGSENKKHKIDIEINCNQRSIEISDTGIGIDTDKIEDLLAPHGSDKNLSDPVIGQKGVGLTYTIFTADYYEIETKSLNGYIKGSISNSVSWKKGNTEVLPNFEIFAEDNKKFKPEETFTKIFLKNIETIYDDSEDLFNLSIENLILILRTKTAIGYIKGVFNPDDELDVEVNLRLIDFSNKASMRNVKPRYLLPTELIPSRDVEILDDFITKAAQYSDEQKSKKLKGKCLLKRGSIDRNSRIINYFCFFAPSRSLWDDICSKNGFIINNTEGETINQYEGGILVGSKGMPTGIRLEPPRTGYSGYWPNIFLLFEDDSINFDLGRKAIPSRTIGVLKEIAKRLLNEIRPFIDYVRTERSTISPHPVTQQLEKSKTFEILKNKHDLGVSKLNILKHPEGQEAIIVALFHELVAAKYLKGYYTYSLGYKQTYDLWGQYSIEKKLIGKNQASFFNKTTIVDFPFICEFKYNAESILDDFESDIKFFTDIDLIVCWDFDERKFAAQAIEVEVVKDEDVLFFGTTHKICWPGSYNLGAASEKPVIALRHFIDKIKRE